MAGEGGELVRRTGQRQAGQRCQFPGDGFGEAGRRVEAGADGGAALSQFADRGQGGANGGFGMAKLGDEGGKLLAKGDRRGIHHVGAPGLDQVGVALRLFLQAVTQFGDGWQQAVFHGLCRRDVHGGGEAVVGTLRAIDVIVGVYRALAATAATCQLIGATGDDLVDVHVALRAAASLPDHQGELRVVLAVEHFVRGLFDQSGNIGWQLAAATVDPRSGFLDQGQGMQHGQRHAFGRRWRS